MSIIAGREGFGQKTIVIGIIGGLVVFGILIGIIATGLLEGPPQKENNYITLVLRKEGGELKAIAISGVLGTNPTIVMRSSPDHQMNLTVLNQDEEAHQLVIDGLNVSTKLLDPYNRTDTIAISGGEEGSYTYRCALHENEVFGELRIVRVTARG
jgi:hypothetical protein